MTDGYGQEQGRGRVTETELARATNHPYLADAGETVAADQTAHGEAEAEAERETELEWE